MLALAGCVALRGGQGSHSYQGETGIPADRSFSRIALIGGNRSVDGLTVIAGKTSLPWKPTSASFPGVPGEGCFSGIPSFPPNSGLRAIGVIDVPPALPVDSCGAVDPAKDFSAAVASVGGIP